MQLLNVLMIFFVAFASYIECHDGMEKVKAAAEECKERTGATDADVEALFKQEPAGSKEAKCLHACVMKSFGLMDDDGKMHEEKAKEILKILTADDEEQENLGLEILEGCIGIDVNEDHCEAAEEYRTCMHDKATENGFKFGRI